MFEGITGRLNGAGAEFWGQGGPHAAAHNMHHQSKMPVGPGGNGNTGWEEPSPPAARRNTVVPNYDDGTSLWGTPSQPQRMGGKFCEYCFCARRKIDWLVVVACQLCFRLYCFLIYVLLIRYTAILIY